MIEPIETAAELYREIKRRGLHLRQENGRDSALYNELCDKVNCSNISLQDYLDTSEITAEQFLKSFLEITQPFAQMFMGIWDFLSVNIAPKALETISVRFGFPESSETCTIDWEQFRRYAERSQIIITYLGLKLWPIDAINKLFHISNILLVNNDTRYWEPYSKNGGYSPGSAFQIPKPIVGSHNFDLILQEIASLFQTIINDYEVECLKKESERRIPELLDDSDEYESVRNYAYLLTDLLPKWYFILKYPDTIGENLKDHALNFYQTEILPIIKEDQIESQIKIKKALDILDLPFWRHRWHTYEVWATIVTIKALEEYRPNINIINGYVPIDGYSEEIIANLMVKGFPNACIGLQIQTPFISEKRIAIKPDLRVCFSKDIIPEATASIVEFKQRSRMDRAYVEEIARAYSNGSPKSGGTIIINYDITRIEVSLPNTCYLLEGINPSHSENIQTFKEILNDMLRSVGYIPKIDDVIVLLDVSGSMGDSYRPIRVQQALRKLIQKRWIKILRFSDGLLPGGDLKDEDIKIISTKGRTLLGQALKQIEQKFSLPSKMLVVTDGGHDNPVELMRMIPNIRECSPDELEQNLSWL
ncbi:MAG: VWA domain-containing protein [Candidatus Helarchaeota archaeon]|nr:VWA domain-containing protein [Candidatus Helarchaeota archaeon]